MGRPNSHSQRVQVVLTAIWHVIKIQKHILSNKKYRKICNISRTKSQDLNGSRLVLQLYLCNLMQSEVKPGIM